MAVILLASRKGGSGKTTLAVHLAALARQSLLIDADPQGSATFWAGCRELARPEVIKVSAYGVKAELDKARDFSTVIIDSPPHDASGIRILMGLCDLVVIPSRPGPLDLAAVGSTIEIARALAVPFVVLLNATPPPRGDQEPAIVTEAREVLATMGAPVLVPYVSQRADLSHALIGGQAVNEFAPESRAAEEIAAVWRAIQARARKEA